MKTGKLDKKIVEDILALTPVQEGMLFHYLREPGSDLYFEQLSLKVSGHMDIDCFERAWGSVAAGNEMLRTVFRWEKMKNPSQVVLKTYNVKFKYIEYADETAGWLERIKAEDRAEGFDLTDVPFRITLCKIQEGEYEIIISNHHILYDGWSTGIILKEFFAAYTALVNNEVPVKKKKPAFKEFIRRSRGERDRDKEEAYWKAFFNGFDTSPELSIKKKALKTDGTHGTHRLRIGKEITEALEAYVKENKITTAALFYGAWGVLLQTYNNSEDVVFGTTVSGRSIKIKGIEDMVGLFINTLPLRIARGPGRFGKEETVEDFLSRVNRGLQAREEYDLSSLVDIKTCNGINADEELFDTLLVMENYPLDERLKQGAGELSVVSYSMFETTHYDLTVSIVPGEEMTVDFYYPEALFEKTAVEKLARHYYIVIKRLISGPVREITGIEILTAEEKKQVLFDFNSTGTGYPREKPVYRLFEEQVRRTPDNVAVVFNRSYRIHKTHKTYISFNRLNRESNRLARLLRRRGLTAGCIAGILLERSVEMVVGILAVLKAGGAYLPIDPEYPRNRMVSMLESSRASFLLTTRDIAGRAALPSRSLEVLVPDDAQVVEELRGENAADPGPVSGPDDLIYIIFTSGSTGVPKGAGVYHRGFTNLMHWFVTEFQLNAGDRNLLMTSPSFDLTQKNLYASLLTGGSLCLPGSGYFDPREFLETVRRLGITWLNCTPGMFYKLVEYETGGKEKFLSSLRYVFLGGEPISMAMLIDWLESEDCRAEVVNTYGPTECTDISNFFRIRSPRRFLEEVIPVGRPVYNVQLYVPDKNLRLLPVGVGGELLIGGAGVGHGYIGDHELTARKFIRFSFGPGHPEQLLYRTGDIVRWLPGGNMEFIGRVDHQVKIRGFRIELGEIEKRLLGHPGVGSAFVMTRGGEDGGGDKYICAYIVPQGEERCREAELREYLESFLPGHMVPSYFVTLKNIPLNPNGKVDRKALPEPAPDLLSTGDYIPPRNKREQDLVNIWSEVLGVESSTVGIDDNFFHLGGHSLKAVGLSGRIHKAFSVEIPIGELFESPTVRGISRYIEKSERGLYSSPVPVEKREYYPLSSAQKRLFFLYRLDPGSITYNLPGIMKVEGGVDTGRFERAFKRLIRRHESLRTSFEMPGESPVQRIHEDVPFKVEYNGIEGFIRPFDLSRAPLLRVGLVKTGENVYMLMFDVHHIVSDGVSIGVLIKDFTALYSEETLPALAFQYKDFALWQNRLLDSDKMLDLAAYWQGQFEREIPVLNLPTDYPRPPVQQFAGAALDFKIGPGETTGLKQLALESGSTLYIVLFALFNLFLSKLSGREDIVAGTVAAGRSRYEWENIIGMFVNTLPIRTRIAGKEPFPEFLSGTKENVLAAFENQDYQYEELVDTLNIQRDLSRNPLFDALFVLQNMEMERVELPGLKLEPCEYKSGTSKFDVTLLCVEDEDGLEFVFEYSTVLFKESTVHRFINYFKQLLSNVLMDRERCLYELELIPPDEKEKVLFDFNNTRREYPSDKTIHRLFRERVRRTPDRVAVVYNRSYRTYKTYKTYISFKELNRESNRLAHLLRSKGVGRGSLVGLMVDRSPEMMTGILGILKAGGAYLPISPDYPETRINHMLGDCNVDILLLDSSFEHRTGFNCRRIYLDQPGFYDVGAAVPDVEDINTSRDLAYVMYTSGSTGKSKGVMVEHRSVVRLVIDADYVELNHKTRILQTGAVVFDAVTFEMWGSLLNGGQLHLVPNDIILDAQNLGKVLADHRINTLWLSAPLFNQLAGHSETLFSPLEWLVVGGDVLTPGIINRVRRANPGLRIVNGYGPTENTTFSVCYPIRGDFDSPIPIGRPIGNSTAYILDAYGRPQPIGVFGELYVGGDGVSRGYLNRPGLTAERFSRGAAPSKRGAAPSKRGAAPSSPLYRTGDRARWLPDGPAARGTYSIEFAGRLDDQVKIRGFRVEPGEIENRLSKHPGVKEALVMVRHDNEADKYLCAYVVPHIKENFDEPELREYLAGHLPDYMVPSYFVLLEKIPLNPNGKVDRKALPEPHRTDSVGYVPPRNEREEVLVEIWSGVLGIENNKIGIDHDFFELGGHSLKAVGLTGRIRSVFSVEMPLTGLFESPTVRGISDYIEKSGKSVYSSLEPVEEKEYYLLSSAQKRLFFLYRLAPGSVTYNLPAVLKVEGRVEKGRFEDAFKQLIRRHESLRTSFGMLDETPVQKIHNDAAFKIEYNDTGMGFIRPFDLSRAPLLRVALVETGENAHTLMFDMHHIVSDGVSMGILINEFTALYSGENLPGLEFQYKDFAFWQNRLSVSGKMNEQAVYWRGQFEGEIPVSTLPTDYPRPSNRKYTGGVLGFEIGPEETAGLNRLALETGSTLYMVLFALFDLLLSKLSGGDDIIVGTVSAGRNRFELENIIGMFVNTLAVRTHVPGEKPFPEFLSRVKENILAAFENQDYQYEELVETLDIERDFSRNPLFDVMFVLQNMDIPPVELPGLKLEPQTYETGISKFDLTFRGEESGDKLAFDVDYSAELFTRETAARFIDYYKKLTAAVLDKNNSDLEIGKIEIISEAERKRLLYEFNNTASPYPAHKMLHECFEEQVEKSPDSIALLFKDRGLTYRALDNRAGELSSVLMEKGVKPGVIAALMVERSIEMITGLLAILKAGGTYLPVDIEYPAERIQYMIDDSAARFLLTRRRHLDMNPLEFNGTVIEVDAENIYRGNSNTSLPKVTGIPGNPAYVIYTSGSTGKPRGVLAGHASVVNLAFCQKERFGINVRDRVLQFSSICFDASVEQIFIALFSGAALVLTDTGTLLDNNKFEALVSTRSITHIHAVPGFLSNIRLKDTSRLKRVIAGGDVCPVSLAKKWSTHCDFYNEYGPTETTVTSIEKKIEGVEDDLPRLSIGRPIRNTTVYLFDKWMLPVPLGTVGELYIGGDGVAGGYLNRPESTSEMFVPNPLVDGERLYRSGDLARWLPDGDLEFLGRTDFQVKIRGYRIELGEIENRLLKHEGIKDAVVTAGKENGDNYLCAYVVPGSREQGAWENTAGLREYLARFLPGYMVPAYFVLIEKMPLTPSGKVDRKALPEPAPGRTPGRDYVPPRNRREEALVEIWSEVLGVESSQIGIDDNFFHLGGHSLKAVGLAVRINKVFSVEMPVSELFNVPTVKGIAGYIAKSEPSVYASLAPVEKKEYYSPSSAQARLFFLHQLEPGSITYNLPGIMKMQGIVEMTRFEGAFKQLIRRHESLRTSFEMVGEEPVQKIREDVAFKIDDYDRVDDFVRPFDLSRAPLLRVGLVNTGENEHTLMFDMHHIVSDGVSMGVLINEFAAIYTGETLPELEFQYKDFASWRNGPLFSGRIKEQEKFWTGLFEGEIPVLILPTDYPRPPVQQFAGAAVNFEIGPGETAGLRQLALHTGSTLFLVLFALFNVLLSRLSGQDDIAAGTVASGRNHHDLENIVGMFVNTLVLRTHTSGEKRFRDFITEVKGNVLAAFENQDYPHEDLVEKLVTHRDMSRNPLFDAVFVLQNMNIPSIRLPGLSLTPLPYDTGTSKFDIALVASEVNEGLNFQLEYAGALFKEATIHRFIDYFKRIVSVVLENPDIRLMEIGLASEEEKKRLLVDFNRREFDYRNDKTLHQLFEDRVKKQGDHTAVVGTALPGTLNTGRVTLTYRELNRRSHALACRLREKGTGPGVIVGIETERSLEMILGILGILKTGGAYLPINPKLPDIRKQYVLRDCGTRLLLTHPSPGGETLEIDETISLSEKSLYEDYPGNPPEVPLTGAVTGPCHELAYVIYTSGSTGIPKGVPITHFNICPLLHWGYSALGLQPADRVIQNLSYFFDWSVWEIFIALTSGSSLYMIPDEILLNPEAEVDFILRDKITVLHITPTQYRYLLNVGRRMEPLKYLFIGAENLTHGQLSASLASVTSGCRVFNMYGPTEATIISAVLEIDSAEFSAGTDNESTSVSIGRAVSNIDLLILDRGRSLSPPGLVGELYIAGDALARGYLNDPERTAERFSRGAAPSTLYYSTGDRARWLPDGTVQFLGRLDHQVKVRGYRIEPGEIEKQILEYEAVSEALVLVREYDTGEKYLCAYIVPAGVPGPHGRPGVVSIPALKEYLSGRLPDYMVPPHFVTLEKMPLNPNGKVDRKALPEPDRTSGGGYVPPGNEREKALVEIWSEVLDVESGKIGIEDDFFELGGHSLKAVQLAGKIHHVLGAEIHIQELFRFPTIVELSRLIHDRGVTPFSSIVPQPPRPYYDLSFSQKRLWFICKNEPGNTSFNMPGKLTLYEAVDHVIIRQVLERLTERHESLRTSFKEVNLEPMQVIEPVDQYRLDFEVVDWSHLDAVEIEQKRDNLLPAESSFRFNLTGGNLFRTKLVKCSEEEYDFVFNMHHIVSDGWSLDILRDEFTRIYRDYKAGVRSDMAPLKIQYKDYTAWQNQLLSNREQIDKADEFWLNQLSGDLPVLNLPYDFNPASPGKASAAYRWVIPEPLTNRLREMAGEHRGSLFMVLLAGFNLLLSRITSQKDILIAIPTAARRHELLRNVIGMFVNTLVLRNHVPTDKPFIGFLKRLQDNTFNALEYQDIPLELICSRLKIKYPEVSVFFNMINIGSGRLEYITNLKSRHTEDVQDTKFDIVCYLKEYKNGIEIRCHYFKDRFKPVTIEKLMEMYRKILGSICDAPDSKIADYFISVKRKKLKRAR